MVSSTSGEQVYATLLLNDAYLAGALVVARSLKDAGTTKKLAVLVTADSVSEEAIAKLHTVYDYVIPVPRIQNERPANLHLMNRSDLHSAFTKIHLWRLTQFSRIVYIDADIVAYRAPDELFNIPHIFGAAPDIGWPDIFNTGVMVLTPNMGDFHALTAMTQRGISFDGADQGLLNQYFGSNYHRLPFTYNVTPSAHYQYLPAYRHFQSSINMVHFIGKNKPWMGGRESSFGGGAFDEMVGRWWAVYDRHYYGQDAYTIAQSTAESWAGSIPGFNASRSSQEASSASAAGSTGGSYSSHGYQYQAPPPIFPWEGHQPKPARHFFGDPLPTRAPALSALVGAAGEPRASPRKPQAPARLDVSQRAAVDPHGDREPQSAITAPSVSEMDTVDNQSEAITPTTPSRSFNSDPWTSYPRLNAWDDVPGINRYVEGFERYRRMSLKSQKGAPQDLDANSQDDAQARGTKVTDFPTETERPSLPVTPAPVRRSSFWSQDDEDDSEAGNGRRRLPIAEGVPDQSEWDPAEQLQKLAAQQSEVLLRKLSGMDDKTHPNDTPYRPLPLDPEEIVPPAGVAQSIPKLLSPQPVKGTASVMTSSLERKMQQGDLDFSDARPVTWDEDEAMELSYHEREVLEA